LTSLDFGEKAVYASYTRFRFILTLVRLDFPSLQPKLRKIGIAMIRLITLTAAAFLAIATVSAYADVRIVPDLNKKAGTGDFRTGQLGSQ
jgi:hypothetical protein